MARASRTPAQLAEALRRHLGKAEGNIEKWLHRVGQEAVNWARTNYTYNDITGNLRNSTGYAVYKDGQLRDWVLEDDGHPEAAASAYRGQSAWAGSVPNEGWSLVIFAGMNYGIWVEARGYVVLAGALDNSEANKLLMEAMRNVT